MKRSMILLLSLVVVVAVSAGVLWWTLGRPDENQVVIQAEETPCGLEWNMTRAEVEKILEDSGYQKKEQAVDWFVVYTHSSYQDIFGTGSYYIFNFTEEDELEEVLLTFYKKGDQTPRVSEGMANDLLDAFEKTYKKASQEAWVHHSVMGGQYNYYLYENSLINTYMSPNGLSVSFLNRESQTSQDIIAELRAEQ